MTEKLLATDALDRLAELCGIQPDYTDVWGRRHEVSPATKQALLAAMGIRVEDADGQAAALEEIETRSWRRWLAPVQVTSVTRPLRIVFHLEAAFSRQPLTWRLLTEYGESLEGALDPAGLETLERKIIGGVEYLRLRLDLPLMPEPGYHRFTLESGGQSGHMALIITPAACYQSPALKGGRRLWGVSTQLYSLQSGRNWGIGDFTDLGRLAETIGTLGADLIGLNPLHALFPDNPAHCSPYSPSSRLFFNILYLDVAAIAEFETAALDADEPAQEALFAPDFQRRLEALRSGGLVDYEGVAKLKLPLLEKLFDTFRRRHLQNDSERAAAFHAFMEEGSEALYRQALFEALYEHFGGQGLRGWSAWHAPYRDPASEAVAIFAAEHRERIEFYQYLQWQATLQLDAARDRARNAGFTIGLYQDLAVSVDSQGGEAWAHQEVYARGVSIGAPPDLYNLKGQDWGLPPLNPQRLTESAYALFIATLRNNMRHADALRIDHVMGLMRLFWVPAGELPTAGAYIHYPLDDLLGILALESQRNRCLIIGEDLGTVPEAVRQALGPLGVLSYRVLYFEKRNDGSFLPPADYPTQALVAVSTHDLPPLAGFWEGTDLMLRRDLELFPSAETCEQQVVARAEDRARLLIALEQEGLLPEGADPDPAHTPRMTEALACAVHRYAARTPSRLLLVQLEDLLGQRQAINLPATVDEHPNWQRRLPVALEEFSDHPLLRAIVVAIGREREQVAAQAESAPARPSGQIVQAPDCTYRLQFNREFTFAQAAELASYLRRLGVSHCYASPYLKARPGSMHGYDIIDHNALNPEIGSQDDYRRYLDALRDHGLKQVLDIVPNHMGVMGSDNAWWLDLLEHGPASQYAGFFDVDWSPLKRELHGKVLLPVLGDHYGAVLERGELLLEFDAAGGAFSVSYYEHRFPIDPREYPNILNHCLSGRATESESDIRLAEFQSLITALEHLPKRLETAPDKVEERHRDTRIHKQRLAALCTQWPQLTESIADTLKTFNGALSETARHEPLHRLLDAQAYRLAYWRVAADEINYRRFFDVNDLAALRMEDPRVFETTHQLIFDMIARGEADGLRIDHPDGLYDPADYYRRLHEHAAARAQASVGEAAPLYLIVEKILAPHEHLPKDWPVAGTSGYDFANLVNGVFIDSAGQKPLNRIYARFIGHKIDFDELLYACKKQVIRRSLSSELHVLANRLSRICEADPRTRDFTRSSLHDALLEVVACFPVYRTYITPEGVAEQDRQYVDWAVAQAKKRAQDAETSVYGFIRAVLLQELPADHAASRQTLAGFTMQFQQYTAPVMAKGLEDTALYNDNRLISLNEVGGDPRRFGVSVSAFHHQNRERARHFPHALLGTTTHDAKRAEDVRARINVLSEMPREWNARVFRWARINRSRKRRLDGQLAPDRNDEYLLYQTLIGSWPLEEQDADGHARYIERIRDYMLKAAREAKRRTSWINQDEAYEEALTRFVEAVLERENSLFLDDFIPFQQRIARLGMYNSLAQATLKFTAPGVPDIYQGNELWDFSLVDPDNRRPVDYDRRRRMLDDLIRDVNSSGQELKLQARRLLDTMQDGRIKLYLTWKLLDFRRRRPRLFCDGDYQALEIRGVNADHLCAFARSTADETAIVIVPRLLHALTDGGDGQPLGSIWADTLVQAPLRTEGYTNVLTGEPAPVEYVEDNPWLPAAGVLANFPMALLAV